MPAASDISMAVRFPVQQTPARLLLLVLLALLPVTMLIAFATGAVSIMPAQIVAIVGDVAGFSGIGSFEQRQANVLLGIRLPRVLLAVLAGGGLGSAGAAMQGMFRNPLADPALIGVSSGASLGAVTVLVLGLSIPFITPSTAAFALPVAAFLGGACATVAVYRIAGKRGETNIAGMLLAGIAVNAIAGAAVGLLSFTASDAQLRSITFWSLGSLGGATWMALATTAPLLLTSMVLLPRVAGQLNALLLGEAEAAHLGVDVEGLKRRVVVLSSLAVGACVAVAGVIGFIGLVAPHLVRLIAGPNHRHLLPASALLGAVLLLGADIIARTIVTPAELPIGIVTALLGAPFFLWLLIREHRGGRL
jgi:iron complex transport system permease protein